MLEPTPIVPRCQPAALVSAGSSWPSSTGEAVSVVLLFGAGASFGSRDCTPHPPPLGADLLAALQKRRGVAATIAGELGELFRSDFEAGMLEFYRTRPVEVPALLREMANYFSDFEPGPRNYYRTIVDAARSASSEVVIATTNYDALLELSITQSGARFCHTGRPVPQDNFSVLRFTARVRFCRTWADQVFEGSASRCLRERRS